VVRTKS